MRNVAGLLGLVLAVGLGPAGGSVATAAVTPPPAPPPDWTLQPLTGAVAAPPASLGAANRVALAAGNNLYSVFSDSGILRTTTTFPSPIAGSPVIVQNDFGQTTTFAATQNNLVARVDDAGAVVWERNVDVDRRCRTAPPSGQTPPAVLLRRFTGPAFQVTYPSGSDLVIVTQPPLCDSAGHRLQNGIVAAYRALDGTPVWTATAKGAVVDPPVVDALGGRVYVLDRLASSSLVEAFSIRDGSRLWTAGIKLSLSTPVQLGDRVYALAQSGELYALDAAQGTLQWTAALSDTFFAPLVGRATGGKRYVMALDAARQVVVVSDTGPTGKFLWSAALGDAPDPAVNIADVDPTISFDPGPYVWLGGSSGRIDEFALDKHAFASDDPLKTCRNTTVTAGQLIASRQMPGTTAGATVAPTWLGLHTPQPGATSTKLVASTSTQPMTTIQISVPWDCGTAGVGTARLTPRRLSVARGQRFALALSWRHPRSWRKLAYLELRLRRGKRVVAWTILDQRRRTLRLWTGRPGRFGAAARPGRALVRHGGGAILELAHSAQRDNGKGGRVLGYRAALRIARTVPTGRYVVEALAADTGNAVQGFQPVGNVTVRRHR